MVELISFERLLPIYVYISSRDNSLKIYNNVRILLNGRGGNRTSSISGLFLKETATRYWNVPFFAGKLSLSSDVYSPAH